MTTSTTQKITRYWPLRVQEYLACVCCIGMVAGMLFSRGLLSVSMIVMVLNALHPATLQESWARCRGNRFALFSLLFFLSYAVSGFWSQDIGNWSRILQIKLPFLFLPFAFINAPLHEVRLQRYTIYGILLTLLGGMVYSISFLVADPGYFSVNPHLPSPLEGDYIRFTIALVLGLHLIFYLFSEKNSFLLKGAEKALLVLWSVAAIAYIHIQAAKSGMLCLYLLIIIYIVARYIRKRPGLGFAFLFLLGAASIIGGMTIPSIKSQVKNIVKEQKMWESNNTAQFNNASSFVPRLISYKVALELIRDQPLTGVGTGDVKAEIDKKYKAEYPGMSEYFRLIPHNQFIFTALVVGIPLSLLLVLLVFAPLMRQTRNVYTVATLMIMFVGLSIEPMLEVQNGVFVYLFFTLFWMAVFKRDTQTLP
ncbi:O-antigen ligase family protein [Taibaiella chishuiensis]|uniref:O-antigen ligase n=1 Tax=Taibaiella chishuiensis TaxID=1434707 RepID=A0A2P8D9X8_9BACT|nr:O-antigen ligase family protein [Taibaiella chishuiensis]PSK93991.1 O-antigen ligase [Taibaiella chishuiensis]